MASMRSLHVISDIFVYTENLVKLLKIIKIIILITMTIMCID